MRYKKSMTGVSMALILILISISYSGCCAPVYWRHVAFKYVVNIEAKPGETPKDVTVIIPFQVEDGVPVRQVLDDIKAQHSKNFAKYYPDVTFSIASTKYGKMLKVHIPELKGGYDLGSDYAFYGVFDGREMKERFPLSGVNATGTKVQIRMSNRPNSIVESAEKSITHIFVSYKDATGLVFKTRYGVGYVSASIGQSTIGNGTSIIMGTNKYPYADKSSGNFEFQVKKGWQSLPALWVGE